MQTHELKIWPEYFKAVVAGLKRHEIRSLKDRTFNVGDKVYLNEYDPTRNVYTGWYVVVIISYVSESEQWGISSDIAVFSFNEWQSLTWRDSVNENQVNG